MAKTKKREIECPHSDCFFYSVEHTELDGEWIPISSCSHPNNDLIDSGKSCKYYRVDWAKQLHKVRRANPVERVKLEYQTIVKLLQLGVGRLSPDERDTALGLVEQLKLQEERLSKLGEIQNEINHISEKDPYVIEEPESTTPEKEPQPVKLSEPEEPEPVPVIIEEKPKEESPTNVVCRFIESWNKQMFQDEYSCLGETLKVIQEIDYIRSRQFAYADAAKQSKNGHYPTQELGKVHSVKIDGETARIICDKIEKYSRFPKTYQQKYILHKENGTWKINNVQTRER